MKNLNITWHYDVVTKLLHWILAVLLIGLIALGWYMMSIENQPGSGWYFNLHKSFGIIAATLILLRLIWVFSHKPAPLPTSVPRWQAKIARGLHMLLYICMILMPITGFIGASFSKHGVAFFGLELPSWGNPNHDIAEQFFNIHGIIAWALVVLITLHLLAALKHLVINKDGVFQRMWF
ncbi:cytochrome b/b6 domain-containing protein [soil metagenome]